jgi:hypothetical protein
MPLLGWNPIPLVFGVEGDRPKWPECRGRGPEASWRGGLGPSGQWNRRGCLASPQRGQQANGHHEPRRSQHSFEERRLCSRLSVVTDATGSLRIPTPLLCQSEIIFPTLSSWGEFFQPNSLWLTLLWIWSTDFIRRVAESCR